MRMLLYFRFEQGDMEIDRSSRRSERRSADLVFCLSASPLDTKSEFPESLQDCPSGVPPHGYGADDQSNRPKQD